MKKHTFLTIGLAVTFALGATLGLVGCNEPAKSPSDNSGESSSSGTGENTPQEGEDKTPEEENKPFEIVDEEEKSEGYASVSYIVREKELFNVEAGYTPLQIFGRLNYTFKHKTDWYAVYIGNVDTILPQEVTTLKQYHDGVLLSTDISTSMLLNTAKEFCYIPAADRVMWREASTNKPTEYDGFNTPWKETLAGDMKIDGADGFKETNGLPAYELSVYVFRAETIADADEIVDNKDGTFKLTFHLDPTVTEAEDGTVTGAAAYYSKQMKFTSGGMTAGAEFSEITVSFTFNAQWETIKTEIGEAYKAKTAFGDQPCTATGTTTYTYDASEVPFAECDHYETYFKAQPKKDAE